MHKDTRTWIGLLGTLALLLLPGCPAEDDDTSDDDAADDDAADDDAADDDAGDDDAGDDDAGDDDAGDDDAGDDDAGDDDAGDDDSGDDDSGDDDSGDDDTSVAFADDFEGYSADAPPTSPWTTFTDGAGWVEVKLGSHFGAFPGQVLVTEGNGGMMPSEARAPFSPASGSVTADFSAYLDKSTINAAFCLDGPGSSSAACATYLNSDGWRALDGVTPVNCNTFGLLYSFVDVTIAADTATDTYSVLIGGAATSCTDLAFVHGPIASIESFTYTAGPIYSGNTNDSGLDDLVIVAVP